MLRNLLWCFPVAAILLSAQVFAQPEMDTSFSADGKAILTFGVLGTTRDVAVQPDKKIILVGECSSFSGPVGGFHAFCTVRLNENGSHDTSFGVHFGAAFAFPGGGGGGAHAVAIQNDGKIISVGYIGAAEAGLAMVRYNTDGTLDTSFGTDGKVVMDVIAGNHDRAGDVVIQPDGKILVAGGDPQQFVARFLPDGTLDSSFGTSGVAKIVVAGQSTTGLALALAPDGKIVAGGNASPLSSYLLTRFNPDGSPDTTWDGDAVVTVPYANGAGEDSGIRSLAVRPDGRVVALGHGNIVFRFNPNGLPDTTFSGVGFRTPALSGFLSDPRKVVTSAGGRITVGGGQTLFSGPGSIPYNYLVSRFLPDGASDSSFSDDGYLKLDLGMSDRAYGLALDPLGRFVIAGVSSNCCVQSPFGQPQFSVARMLAPPAAAVEIVGRITNSDGNAVPFANLAITSGGNIIAQTRSNPFGYYVFSSIMTGQNYTVSVAKKGFTFADRDILVIDDTINFDFVAEP